jgi:anti-sigma-K factor RskA
VRTSILDAAAAERTNVVPLRRRRWAARGLAVAAAAVACIVVGLAVSLSQSSQEKTVTASIVLGPNRTATLHVTGLSAAPSGKTYEAWVIPAGSSPQRAGLFPGGASTTIRLQRLVPRNAVVAVTVEPAGGVDKPTTKPIFSAPA